MKIYKRIQNIIIIIAGFIVVSIVTLFMIFNIRPVVIISGSMEPEIMTGSMAFIDYDLKEPIIGDIVAYNKENMLVVHRIESVAENGYITKGDNNKVEDIGVVNPYQIQGKYVFSIPYAGYALSFVKSAKGVTIIITAMVIFILIGIFLKNNNDN